MFQTIVVLAVFVGVAVALPRPDFIPILSETRTQDESGQFSLTYQTGNGISVTDHGSLKPNADRTDNIPVRQVSINALYHKFMSENKNKKTGADNSIMIPLICLLTIIIDSN